MVAVAGMLVMTCLTGWLALRITLLDNTKRGSLLIARDLAPLARQDLAATGRLSARVLGPGSTVVEAIGSDGTVLTVPGEDVQLFGSREVEATRQRQMNVRNTISSSGETYQVVTVALSGLGDVLVVGRPLTASYQVLNVFGLVELVAGGVGLGCAWLLSRGVARTALQPVRRFTDAVQHVAETEDLQPVPAEHVGGDLATLTDAFNRMLAQLAASRDQQNRLIADASHELRTPLTSMRTNVELLALDTRTRRLGDADRAKILDDVHAQTVEFSALIADLLHLARDKRAITHSLVDLRGVVQAALERVRRRGPGLTFDVDLDSLILLGDAAALEQAVINLLDNAVKWSPPGGTICVRLHGHELSVTDQGPGIAEADLPHIFDRFYRAEAARSTPGTGLGLAITAKTVHDHGSTIHVDQAHEGGARFTIKFTGVRAASATRDQPAPRLTHRPSSLEREARAKSRSNAS